MKQLKEKQGIKCDCPVHIKCEHSRNHCSPLQEPREKKEGFCKKCNRYFVEYNPNHSCFGELSPQPEKTDYQKRIEEILDNNTFFSERSGGVCLNRNVIKNLLSLLQEVRSEERTKIKRRVGFLRQWLNEDRITRIDKMVDTGDLDDWLFTDKL